MSESVVSKGIGDARKARVPGSGSFAIFTPASPATGAGSQIMRHISQSIAIKKDKCHFLAIYCDLTKVDC